MKATVVIPLYRTSLTADERLSLEQIFRVLGNHPLVVVKPASLDTEELSGQYPQLRFESFSDAYFESIKSYNGLMLSSEFYERFSESEYILIYQLDAYVFRDELLEWCAKRYDYIGAPWIRRKIYNLPPVAAYMWLNRTISRWLGRPNRQTLYNRVGNGGFSLRKVQSHLQVTQLYAAEIADFMAKEQHHLYNEDVFWSVEVNRVGRVHFTYPDCHEALQFSFDKYPEYCFELTGHRLPFGCHAWSKPRMIGFWRRFIA